MRAFHRGQTRGSASLAATNHVLLHPQQALEDWAPPAVLQLSKALAACGVTLLGPTLTYEEGCIRTDPHSVCVCPSATPSTSLRATENHRFHIACRLQSVHPGAFLPR